jgi:transcriptional regulator with XRE-family HTH domain
LALAFRKNILYFGFSTKQLIKTNPMNNLFTMPVSCNADSTEIGLFLKNFRELHNYSQNYMSNQVGVSQGTYSKMENGISTISYSELGRICYLLEIKVKLTFSPFELLQESEMASIKHKVQNQTVTERHAREGRDMFGDRILNLESMRIA